MATTSLTKTAPLAHRIAHRYCAAGWRGRTATWRLADRWAAPTCAVVEVAGGGLTVDRRFWLDREIYRGFFEVAELDLISPLITPGDSCVDVGANIGLYSVLFAARSGHGPVIAFEPSPSFTRLEENLRPFTNTTALNFGLGAATDTLRLHLADGDHHANIRDATDADAEVEIRRLDEVPEVQALAEVDFLKVDVEGWESEVMAGATNLWNQHRIGMALIEANPMWDAVDYLDHVKNLGYTCFVVRLRQSVGGLRNVLHLEPLNLNDIPLQINVLVVRPDRLNRLRRRLR
jgi:FkbM family methyltransferase